MQKQEGKRNQKEKRNKCMELLMKEKSRGNARKGGSAGKGEEMQKQEEKLNA